MITNQKLNILMIDDQPGKLLSYRAILDDLGENLISATTAKETLDLLLKNEIAIILMDVSMPGMSGLELLSTLREQQGKDLPAVFLSARVQPEDIERGRALGASYLTKPFVASALLNAVERALAEANTAGW